MQFKKCNSNFPNLSNIKNLNYCSQTLKTRIIARFAIFICVIKHFLNVYCSNQVKEIIYETVKNATGNMYIGEGMLCHFSTKYLNTMLICFLVARVLLRELLFGSELVSCCAQQENFGGS